MKRGFSSFGGNADNLSEFQIDPSNWDIFKVFVSGPKSKNSTDSKNIELSIDELKKIKENTEKLKLEIDSKLNFFKSRKPEKDKHQNTMNSSRNLLALPTHTLQKGERHKESFMKENYVKESHTKDKKSTQKTQRNENRNKFTLLQVNKKSVWYTSEPFFQPLPTNDEVAKMFRPLDNMKEWVEIKGPVQHWTVKMNEFRQFPKMKTLPDLPEAENEEDEYWKEVTLPFQLEDMQKRKNSIFHKLLSSFVKLDGPIKRDENRESKQMPLITHSLLPYALSDSYLSYTFDQRLDLEILSLGLNLPDNSNSQHGSLFDEEIEEIIKENKTNLAPVLIELRDQIINNIDKYREQQEKRNEFYKASRKKLVSLSNEK